MKFNKSREKINPLLLNSSISKSIDKESTRNDWKFDDFQLDTEFELK